MNQSLLIFFALVLASVALWVVTKLLKKKIEEQNQSNLSVSNLDGKHPKLLTRVNGCGCTMLGDFRQVRIGEYETFVSYYFFCFIFIPLVPLKCYRVISEDHYQYRFLGLDRMNWKEVLCVYTNAFKWVFSLVSIVMLFFLLFD